MRASRIICTAAFLTLLLAATSLAGTSAHAYTDTSYTSDDDLDQAGHSVMITVAGCYDWSYSLYAWAEAGLRGSDPGGSASQGLGTASVSGIASDSVFATISVSDECDTQSTSDSASDSGSGYMIVGDDLTFSELSAAYASCGAGAMQAMANSSTSASGTFE